MQNVSLFNIIPAHTYIGYIHSFFVFVFLGIFTAAHDMTFEWVVVKGVSDFAISSSSTHESWKSFASVMAASVVSNMLCDSFAFQQWRHFGGMLKSLSCGCLKLFILY